MLHLKAVVNDTRQAWRQASHKQEGVKAPPPVCALLPAFEGPDRPSYIPLSMEVESVSMFVVPSPVVRVHHHRRPSPIFNIVDHDLGRGKGRGLATPSKACYTFFSCASAVISSLHPEDKGRRARHA